ncbi:MAG: hypothetical protein H7A23_15265 [Leptospiraceae bacterium]|nr:hypothetical protein [Leptospiraceae bacterium]MCP5495910.1 hypothetical protein [Leptospiraceae bacterium]
MKNPKRISFQEAREKALPILLAGYNKRKKLRSSKEESKRCQEKLDRDRRYSSRPRLSPI